MGRHSANKETAFYRSIFQWLLPWLLLAGVTALGIWIGVSALGGAQEPLVDQKEASDRNPSAAADAQAEVVPPPDDEPAVPETEKGKKDDGSTKRDGQDDAGADRADDEVQLITKDITVQVLNGTTSAGADDAMADRLADAGFTVVAIEAASGSWDATTVFWSYPEAEAAAQALADRFGWVAERKPANLSDTVSLHVVVGRDAT